MNPYTRMQKDVIITNTVSRLTGSLLDIPEESLLDKCLLGFEDYLEDIEILNSDILAELILRQYLGE